MIALDLARALHAKGITALPVAADKRPMVSSWREYRDTPPPEHLLADWFKPDSRLAIIAGGPARICCLDIDSKHDPEAWHKLVTAAHDCGLHDLIERALIQTTPSGGKHLVWRCPGVTISGNEKLARNAKGEAFLETRGQGGYFLASPSPGYVLENGAFTALPAFTPDEHHALLDAARSCDEAQPVVYEPKQAQPKTYALGLDLSPGDDYNQRGDPAELLRNHGWTSRNGTHWTRPGKQSGVSATLGKCDGLPKHVRVFSSSVGGLEPRAYSPWALFAALECGGDYREAASKLARMGYGSRPKAPARVAEPVGALECSAKADSGGWAVRKASEMAEDVRPAPPELISGMLYSGGTMMMAGASKSMKSYTMIALGLAVASGGEWLGFKCAKAPVLFLNLELQVFAMEARVREVAAAMRIDLPDTFMVVHLRGVLVSVDAIEKQLGALLSAHSPGLVIVDPHYKVSAASGVEENSNDEQGRLLYRLENLICGALSGLCISHHFSKGDKSQTKAMDRAAGGGALARWGDVMMSITDHEEEGCAVAEFSLRNFRPIPAFGLRWDYPLWFRDPRLDPAKLRKPGRPSTGGPDDLIQFVQQSGSSRMDVVNAAMAAGKGGKSTVQSKIKTLLDGGKLREMSGILFPA